MGLFFGILSSCIPLNESFQFYPDYWYLFVLLIIVLFLTQWMKARIFFKGKSFKWMAITGCVQLSFSLGLSQIPIIDSKEIDSAILKNTPGYYCSYELPNAAISFPTYRNSLTTNVYFGISKQNNDSLVLLGGHRNPVLLNLASISNWITQEKELLVESEQDLLMIQLYADKHIKTKKIKELIKSLRLSRFRYIKLMTSPKERYGLPWFNRPFCEEIYPRDTSSQYPPSPSCYLSDVLKNLNKISVDLKENKFWIKGITVSEFSFLIQAKSHIRQNGKNSFFEIFVDNESDYDHLIKIHELIRRAYAEIWQEEIKIKYSKIVSFEELDLRNYNPELEKAKLYVRGKYPLNYLQWSDEEVEFFKLKK
jgi:biopolymer transport protein ExbD